MVDPLSSKIVLSLRYKSDIERSILLWPLKLKIITKCVLTYYDTILEA